MSKRGQVSDRYPTKSYRDRLSGVCRLNNNHLVKNARRISEGGHKFSGLSDLTFLSRLPVRPSFTEVFGQIVSSDVPIGVTAFVATVLVMMSRLIRMLMKVSTISVMVFVIAVAMMIVIVGVIALMAAFMAKVFAPGVVRTIVISATMSEVILVPEVEPVTMTPAITRMS